MKIIKKFHPGLLLVLTISLYGCNPVPVINGARRAPAAVKIVGIAPSSIKSKPNAFVEFIRNSLRRVNRERQIIQNLNLQRLKVVKYIKMIGICHSDCDEIINSFMKAGFQLNDISKFKQISHNIWKAKMTEGLALSLKNKDKIIMPGRRIIFRKPKTTINFHNDVYTTMDDEIILVIPESEMKKMMSPVDSVFVANYRPINHEEHQKLLRAFSRELESPQELVGKDILTLK